MRNRFSRRQADASSAADLDAELDRDLKGRTEIYIDGRVLPARRAARRPPPASPGRRAEDPLDDAFPMPFVPRPDSEPGESES